MSECHEISGLSPICLIDLFSVDLNCQSDSELRSSSFSSSSNEEVYSVRKNVLSSSGDSLSTSSGESRKKCKAPSAHKINSCDCSQSCCAIIPGGCVSKRYIKAPAVELYFSNLPLSTKRSNNKI